MSRGAEPGEAQLHEGASEPAVDTCLISAVAIRKAPSSPNDCRSPVWNTGRFAATNVAAHTGENHTSRTALSAEFCHKAFLPCAPVSSAHKKTAAQMSLPKRPADPDEITSQGSALDSYSSSAYTRSTLKTGRKPAFLGRNLIASAS